MGSKEITSTASKFGGKYLGKFIGFFFIFLFIIIPILYAITISIQAGSVEPGFTYIAPKIIAPVQTLNEQSLIAVEQEGTYIRTGNFFSDTFNFFKFYWLLLGSLYMIYKWNSVLCKAMPATPFSNNTSARMTNIALAILIFVVIQMIFLGYMASADPNLGYWDAVNTPFKAVWNFGKAAPFFIAEANSVVDFSGMNGNKTLDPLINETINGTSNESMLDNISVIDTSKSSVIIY